MRGGGGKAAKPLVGLSIRLLAVVELKNADRRPTFVLEFLALDNGGCYCDVMSYATGLYRHIE